MSADPKKESACRRADNTDAAAAAGHAGEVARPAESEHSAKSRGQRVSKEGEEQAGRQTDRRAPT
jgi:hypothetical protein